MSTNGEFISITKYASYERLQRVSFGNESENWRFLKQAWLTAGRNDNEAGMQLILSLARLTRNLVAQVPNNQEKALYALSDLDPFSPRIEQSG
jgi:hypothetical protein